MGGARRVETFGEKRAMKLVNGGGVVNGHFLGV